MTRCRLNTALAAHVLLACVVWLNAGHAMAGRKFKLANANEGLIALIMSLDLLNWSLFLHMFKLLLKSSEPSVWSFLSRFAADSGDVSVPVLPGRRESGMCKFCYVVHLMLSHSS